MKFRVSAPLVMIGLVCAPGARAADPSPRDLHAAQCVAALEVLTESLAEEVKAGNEASRALLMERLVSGTAFVGDSYLHGLTDQQQARALADQALEAQKRLTPQELAARQTACADEGTKIYTQSNGLQQAVVTRFAKRRMAKLLGG
ncbi:MAG: hypothetical protein M3O01_04790 [Pseudomonadota bacterium]|nr:hypothetical protein [Pseudomonadota bacterium]